MGAHELAHQVGVPLSQGLLFTRWNFTPGLMPPKFTAERPMIGLGPRMIALVTAQELRANLGEDAAFRGWIDRCIDEIRRLFVKPELRCVTETVGPNGEIIDYFDGRTLNPGHAIEPGSSSTKANFARMTT